MERIQHALAKARAARAGIAAEAAPAAPPVPTPATGQAPGPAPVQPPAPPAPQAALRAEAPPAAPAGTAAAERDRVDAAWAALSDVRVAPPPAEAAPRPDPAAERARIDAEWAALPELRVQAVALERAHVVADKGGHEAAPFDVMRTKLLHQLRANGWRRVAITSPGPACGKTTTALNLAFSLARQSDLRILLAEADLRRPAFARMFGIRPGAGLAEVLEGGVDASQALMRHRANLAILPSAGPRRNPADLFQAPRTGPALDELEARYDPTLTIFDMPPMMIGDDVMAFMGHVDCALLIAAAEATTIKEIDACERELATRTNVMGVVLNKCRHPDRDQGYGYYG